MHFTVKQTPILFCSTLDLGRVSVTYTCKYLQVLWRSVDIIRQRTYPGFWPWTGWRAEEIQRSVYPRSSQLCQGLFKEGGSGCAPTCSYMLFYHSSSYARRISVTNILTYNEKDVTIKNNFFHSLNSYLNVKQQRQLMNDICGRIINRLVNTVFAYEQIKDDCHL